MNDTKHKNERARKLTLSKPVRILFTEEVFYELGQIADEKLTSVTQFIRDLVLGEIVKIREKKEKNKENDDF